LHYVVGTLDMTNPSDRPGRPGEAPSDILASWFSDWADAWRIREGAGEAEPREFAASVRNAVFSAQAQAWWIGAAAWLRYSSAVADALVRYEEGLARLRPDPAHEDSGTSSSDTRVLVDETRTLLRRVGDAASQEARRAQFELEKIGEAIARTAAAGERESFPHDPHARRHEVKP
jgi:hypothetical protein